MIAIFGDFDQCSVKKMAIFSKINVMIIFCNKKRYFESKPPFLRQKILWKSYNWCQDAKKIFFHVFAGQAEEVAKRPTLFFVRTKKWQLWFQKEREREREKEKEKEKIVFSYFLRNFIQTKRVKPNFVLNVLKETTARRERDRRRPRFLRRLNRLIRKNRSWLRPWNDTFLAGSRPPSQPKGFSRDPPANSAQRVLAGPAC
jgi:hypothetical protein